MNYLIRFNEAKNRKGLKMSETIKSEIMNFNSKRLSVVVGAGYLIRELALSPNPVAWYYPVIIGVVVVAYIASQTFSKEQK